MEQERGDMGLGFAGPLALTLTLALTPTLPLTLTLTLNPTPTPTPTPNRGRRRSMRRAQTARCAATTRRSPTCRRCW